jgi:predicted DNA-binding antitoxin AbrB/MazE fold protein
MTTAFKAVYEDGVLKPKVPLQLEEHSEVEVLVLSPAARDADDPTGWKAIDSLIGAAKGAPSNVSEMHDEPRHRRDGHAPAQ